MPSIGLIVEIGKQDDESDGVANQSPLHPSREWAARVERMTRVADGDVKLDLNTKQTGEKLRKV